MSRVKLSSASADEIESFAATLRTAGYLVVQVSPQELEIRPPVPAHIATARQRILAEKEAVVPPIEEPKSADDDTDLDDSGELHPLEAPQREFILAPLFRSMMQPVSHVGLGLRSAGRVISGKLTGLWNTLVNILTHTLAPQKRWHRLEGYFSAQRRSIVKQVHAATIREPRHVRLFVVPARGIDRFGWMMVAAVSMSLLILAGVGFMGDRSNPGQQSMQISQPVISNNIQTVPEQLVPTNPVSPEQKVRSKQKSAKPVRHSVDDNQAPGEDVIIRHFTPQKSQLHPVAGVKHFSDE